MKKKKKYINFATTSAVSAVAIKSFSTAAVVRPVDIVALSIGIAFVGIGGTFVYI